jgi:hypothetical protein
MTSMVLQSMGKMMGSLYVFPRKLILNEMAAKIE